MSGRPGFLDSIKFDWNGPAPTSSYVYDSVKNVATAAIPVGILGGKGWFIGRAAASRAVAELDEVLMDYCDFLKYAAEIARPFIAQGNILDLLPVRLRKK